MDELNFKKKPLQSLPLWAQISIGIIVGFLFIGTIRLIFIKAAIEAAVVELNKMGSQFQETTDRQQEKMKIEQALKAERERLAREREAQKLFAKQRVRKQLQQAEYQKKQAFEQWYTTIIPEECKVPANGDINVECINHRIRAKRVFMH